MGSTISLRLNDEDTILVQTYVAVNDLNLSAFLRELLLDKIEEDLQLDEERILRAKEAAKNSLPAVFSALNNFIVSIHFSRLPLDFTALNMFLKLFSPSKTKSST